MARHGFYGSRRVTRGFTRFAIAIFGRQNTMDTARGLSTGRTSSNRWSNRLFQRICVMNVFQINFVFHPKIVVDMMWTLDHQTSDEGLASEVKTASIKAYAASLREDQPA